MNDQAMHVSGPAVPRLLSLDVLRGIIILAMLFVNDISEVRGTPAWLRHTPTHLDGMTFVDLVFPAFLFMVGMAMPFAFERRLASGEPLKKIWGHVALRSAALVIIGFLMVNAEEMVEGGLLPPVIWQLLMYGGVLLLWAGYGNWKTDHPVRVKSLRLSGGLLLVAAACLYQGRAGGGVLALRPYYWGIIGLIGWAYLTACLFYLPARKNREALLGGMALLYLLFMVEQAGFFAVLPFWPAALRVTDAFATHAAVVLAGVMLGTILQPDAGFTGLGRRVRWVLLFSLGLYLASVLLHALKPLHEMFIISKNLATPVWCLRSSAYTALLWLAVYLLVDVLHFRGGTRFLAAAGGNALFAYILAPIAYNLLGLAFMIFGVSDLYAASSAIFTLGLARAIVIAFFITWLAGFLRRRGLFLKL